MTLTAIAVDASGHVVAVLPASADDVGALERWCDAHADAGCRLSVVPREVEVGEQVLDPVATEPVA